MNPRIFIYALLSLSSCNSKGPRKEQVDAIATTDSNTKQTTIPNKPKGPETISPFDTTSSDYLIYLIKNEKSLNAHWTNKLDSLDIFALPQDSMSHISLIRDWMINDTIYVVILSHSTGTHYDEYLITLRNKHDFVSGIHISDNADSDLSLDNPYFYSQYKLIDDKRIKVFYHKVVGVEGGDEKDRLISSVTFTIQNSGKVAKQ
jgi:hypothetical protein